MAYYHKNLKYHEDTIEKRRITKEDIDFLKELQKEMNTQDNCGTAGPRSWVIKDRKDLQANENSYDYIVLYDSRDCQCLDVDKIYQELLEYMNGSNIMEVKITKYKENEILEFEFDSYQSGYVANDSKYSAYDGISTDSETLEFLKDEIFHDDIHLTFMQVNWIYQFSFLTQKAAENYLRRNAHNHSEDAHTYCICNYRNPQMEKLVNILETVDWDKLGDQI